LDEDSRVDCAAKDESGCGDEAGIHRGSDASISRLGGALRVCIVAEVEAVARSYDD
jgi:hypothetical protein